MGYNKRIPGYVSEDGPHIVVIGGGTGSYNLLSGLKNYVPHIAALVNMADDGGSTGVLRNEYDVLPPGDVRQCLTALSATERGAELFNYRFGSGPLKGHSFGNIFLTAAEKISGSFEEGVHLASDMLHIHGTVAPITNSNVSVRLTTPDGTVYEGENNVSSLNFGSSRPKVWLEPSATITHSARDAILDADMVVIAQGGLYGSLAPTLVVEGVREALEASEAKKVYVCNLMTKHGQTDDFTVVDFADEIERFVGIPFLDYVLYNSNPPARKVAANYAAEGDYPVLPGATVHDRHWKAVGAKVISSEIYQPPEGDPLASQRTLIRHDSDAVARHLMKVYFS